MYLHRKNAQCFQASPMALLKKDNIYTHGSVWERESGEEGGGGGWEWWYLSICVELMWFICLYTATEHKENKLDTFL